ncbi:MULTISPECIES: DUF3037 domain-containing protein [unclassified Neptuniibacter]|uniref:DUF3037 domain-containing protein n=1 Tax=unclassified Neptuniibacter TaxID=2630693 RepID=UPI000C443EE1|nr:MULTISPECIES: DUF3037 domain-containing protein [unclassified Neptuniibacter]MAY42409.1 hypothetical protein [Oceanospirillaceae bacterium]|tara:strand:- start:28814 stop:29677 length:864 start_codon:yes stop_codon:yes gene_type:complete
MSKYACQYKIIRFAPYDETGEFANIGVALFCPASRDLKFKLAPKRFGRITSFFDAMDPAVYKGTIDHLNAELGRFQRFVDVDTPVDLAKQVFGDLMREKGSILRFSDMAVLLTEDMDDALNGLYDHHVQRKFITRTHREQHMVTRLRDTLQRFDLQKAFKQSKLTDGLHEANFPFVRGESVNPLGAIKPLAFDQKAKKGVVESADQWYVKLRSLVDANVIDPEMLLVSMADPCLADKADNDLVGGYLKRIRSDLNSLGINAVRADDAGAVNAFMQIQAGLESQTLSH